MAPTNIFITGVNGYIAGTVLNTLVTSHPDYHITVLVRNKEAGDKISSKYNNVDVVLGTLDDFETLKTQSCKAHIVLNCANVDHATSVQPILDGLSTPFPGETPETAQPRYLIHTSGTSILLDSSFGTTTTTGHRYNDLTHPGELVHKLPDDAWHRNVDKLVLFNNLAPRAKNVHIAIICPPCIYGRGTGTGKIVSWQVPQMIKRFVERGKGFTVNQGETVWGNVHVRDLANIYQLLVERAVKLDESKDVWDGEGGYYLAATGEHHWGYTAQLLAQILHEKRLLKTAELDKLTPDEIRKFAHKTAPLEWGCNSRGKAEHAKKILGWAPVRGDSKFPPNHEAWGQGLPWGLGPEQLKEEVKMFQEGLV